MSKTAKIRNKLVEKNLVPSGFISHSDWIDPALWEEYHALMGALISSDMVQKMREHTHHFDFTCYEHSVFVSYVAFCIARKWGVDEVQTARAGLLHDLYLYDPAIMGMKQCYYHPLAAFENAKKLCPDLTELEANAIRSHMFPLSKEFPKSREALAVNFADKFCATAETLNVFASLPLHTLVVETMLKSES